ncbi:MAG: P-II family nitrogen regulator [Balneolaceae bacterium]
MINKVSDEFKLIVTIVRKNLSRRVVKAVKKAGAEGGTILYGRGSGADEDSFLGIKFEPEKDIILCLVPKEIVDNTIQKIKAAARLERADTGIAFVINSSNVIGIAHLLKKDF